MVRELRKAELHVDEIKANIRRFLRARGCRRGKPWRTPRGTKDKRDARVELPNERTEHEPAVQNLQHDQCNGSVHQLADLRNGNGHESNGHAADRLPAAVLLNDGEQLAR